MGKMISFFNNKGGVGKTTSVHNFAVTLANLGKKVLIIDADLQMNLSFSFSGIIKAPSNASSDNVQSDLFEYDTHVLGLIVQKGRKYENSNNDQKFSKATMAWVEELNKQIDKYKVYANRVNTIISSEDFESVFDFEDAKPYIIAVFYDFGVHLRTLAEQQGIPVVALPENPTSNYQIVLEKTKILYHNIADSLIKLR